MNIKNLKWQATCCQWHGVYAEHPMVGGGVVRIKRGRPTPEQLSEDGEGNLHSPVQAESEAPSVLMICRFGPDNRAIDKDADGVPVYVEMAEAEANALLA